MGSTDRSEAEQVREKAEAKVAKAKQKAEAKADEAVEKAEEMSADGGQAAQGSQDRRSSTEVVEDEVVAVTEVAGEPGRPGRSSEGTSVAVSGRDEVVRDGSTGQPSR